MFKKTFAAVLGLMFGVETAYSEFHLDRSVMSDEYWKIWNDDVQKKIDEDIEKYRKADATIDVSAPEGSEVEINQLSHGFFFGAHIFNFNQLGKKEWNDRYKRMYGELFNSATVAFYWRTLEMYPYHQRFEERYEDTENFWNNCPHPKEQKHWRRPAVDPVISFLKTRGVRIHGHPLVWGNNAWHTPTWLWDDFCPEEEKFALEQATGVKMPLRDITQPICTKDMKNDPGERRWAQAWAKIYKKLSEKEIAALVPTFVKAQKEFSLKRIREIGERYGSRVDSWDVVNESATDWEMLNKRKDYVGTPAKNDLPVTKSHYGLMPPNYAIEAVLESRKVMGEKTWLNVNDYNLDALTGQIADFVANGADFDVVGAQMHLFDPAESVGIARGKGPSHLRPENIAARFKRIAEVADGRSIHLSEITITAPDASYRGQMVQAIIARNLYRAWFSVEKMNGITWWNTVDDCGTVGEPSLSGIFKRDMSEKVVYHALDNLINSEWRTNLKTVAKNGKISFRGFRGRYRLSWKDGSGAIVSKIVEVK